MCFCLIKLNIKEVSKIRPPQDLEKHLSKLKATGILLAGGKSSRMKENKAFLKLQGQSLAERSLAVLDSVFEEVLISSNKSELFAGFPFPVIQDSRPARGPLEGVYQGLQAASYDSVFFAACDMPFLQAEVIRFIARWLPKYDAAVPRLRSGLHPLHAFYHRRCLPIIKNSLETGRLKIIDFYSSCLVRYIEEQELQAFGDLQQIFYNANTPEDWQYVQRVFQEDIL